MAADNFTVGQAKHSTLEASTVDSVTFTGPHTGIIRVRNRATSGDPIYFRLYSPDYEGTQTAPTVAGDDTYVVPFADLCDVGWPGNKVIVKLISAGTPDYSVESIAGLI